MCIRIVRFHYTTKQKKCQDFDGFVNAIYLYDDRITFVFSFKDVTKTVTFAELEESGLGSDINALAAPEKSSLAVYFVRKYTAAKFALRRAKLGFAQLNLLRKLNSALPS